MILVDNDLSRISGTHKLDISGTHKLDTWTMKFWGVFQFKRQRQILRQRQNLNFQRAQNLPYELESLEITSHRHI